jgi:hypothetical protein
VKLTSKSDNNKKSFKIGGATLLLFRVVRIWRTVGAGGDRQIVLGALAGAAARLEATGRHKPDANAVRELSD